MAQRMSTFHSVTPLDAYEDRFKCSCGKVFTCDSGWAFCPDDNEIQRMQSIRDECYRLHDERKGVPLNLEREPVRDSISRDELAATLNVIKLSKDWAFRVVDADVIFEVASKYFPGRDPEVELDDDDANLVDYMNGGHISYATPHYRDPVWETSQDL